MMTLQHAINMNGFGIYVWTAYGMTLSVFVINLVGSILEKKRMMKRIK